MTAIEDARAALTEYDATRMNWDDAPVIFAPVLRALIAEHERLTADVEAIRRVVGAVISDRKYGGDIEWVRLNLRPVAKGTHPRPTATVESLTVPPTDDEREALARDIKTVSDWAISETGWDSGAFDRVLDAADCFRRQGAITDDRIQVETDEGVLVAVDLDGTLHRVKPADDERDALIDDLNATAEWLKRTRNLMDADRVMRAIDALRRQVPITDAQVDTKTNIHGSPENAARMRAALEAARDAL
jgi:hypothetical protein